MLFGTIAEYQVIPWINNRVRFHLNERQNMFVLPVAPTLPEFPTKAHLMQQRVQYQVVCSAFEKSKIIPLTTMPGIRNALLIVRQLN